ncbi:MAG: FIST C-terminal domain-containing protein [Magnetococcales bacterium]|nr:FIST C-terminal domain-containing protein [Magnetococcales bacterium]
MKWTSVIIEGNAVEEAVVLASARIQAELEGQTPDLAIVFASPLLGNLDALPDMIANHLAPRHWLGCCGAGIIGGGEEVEHSPALSITAALLPGVDPLPFHLENDNLSSFDRDQQAWSAYLGLDPATPAPMLLLADPFSFSAEYALRLLDSVFPDSPKIGGLVSGGMRPGSHLLWVDGQTHRFGLAGLALPGAIRMETVVAQGCRPVGTPMFITRHRDNTILELDGRPPDVVLREMIEALDERDRSLMQRALFLGLAMAPARDRYTTGDFLIRNLIHLDQDTGALGVAAHPDPYQVVQFHVRDADAAREELATLLNHCRIHQTAPPAGALLFSCLGRGQDLFDRPSHDSQLFQAAVGAGEPIPLGGFFCNGEIGPVRGRTFLHGFTSSFGLFRPLEAN